MAAASKAKPRHIFDFHIDVGQMLDRPRVNRLFADSLTCPLTAVHAPSGYGKTTAVLQFVQQAQARSVYLSLNDLDKDLPYFWERLAALYARLEPPAGAKLLQLGFPASDSAFAAFAGICKDLTVKEKLLLIIDDFHVADCPDLENWLIKVARLRLKNFHIFILSRNQPSVCGLDLRVKRLVSEITKEHLRFSLPEILAYYALNHIDINETAVQAIDNFTEG